MSAAWPSRKPMATGSQTTYLENVPEGPEAVAALTQLAESGHDIIFTTSFGFMDATNEVAALYPDVVFEHATGYRRDTPNVSTYSARFYEGRTILGHLAGHMTESEPDRLYRVVPDPRSGPRHQRRGHRAAAGQPRSDHRCRLGQHLVRPGRRGGSRQRPDRCRRRHHHPAHRQPGPGPGRPVPRARWRSAKHRTCTGSAPTSC